MSVARQQWEAKLRYKGPMKMVPAPTAAELRAMVNPKCPACYACRANAEAADRLQKVEDRQQSAVHHK